MTNSLHTEIASLRVEVAELKATVANFSETVDLGARRLRFRFNLTPQEACLISLLSDGLQRTKDQIANAIGFSVDRELKTIDVIVCHARKKIAPIKLTTIWGQGYIFEGEHLAAIQKITRGEI